MVRSVNGEDGCCGGRHGCARGRITRWWLARLQVQWRRDDGGAVEKAPLVRGGGARSCNGGRKRRREWKKMVVFGLVAAVVRRRCDAVAGRGATRGRWNAAMADALWRRWRRQMQFRGGGARSSSCLGGREYGARWWCGGRRDWRRRLCGGWKGN
ncbi:hypothetical protein DEO72_LG10g1797 [Vigna unguiculata]|uniref:Uncharacterized protein n=1 Tax=Vigna unguiculata TaxID=3917 RepID=A0A4D6NF58_VIGUN|nr:hypothetical protein DEO72_LG10g1797 [Vigna unguiculata]